MARYFDDPKLRNEVRNRIIGLGEHSLGKSYYPQLNQRVAMLEQTERALRESERNYREIFNATADAIVIFDLKTMQIVDMNCSATEMSGYSDQGMRQMKLGDFSSGDVPYNREGAQNFIQKTIQNGPQLFEWHFRRKDGTLFWGEVTTKLTEIGGLGRLLTTIRNIDDRKCVELEKQAREERIRNQQSALIEIAMLKEVSEGDLANGIRKIIEMASQVIAVDRVGIGLFNEDGTIIKCCDIYERSTGMHTNDLVFRIGDYPIYFHVLEAERVIDSNDVLTDSRVREFVTTYFIPKGVVSALASAVRMRGRVVGVIGFEMVRSARTWQADEIVFAGQVADQVVQILLNAERKKANEEIRKLNEELEERVCQRTAQLEAVNKELESFAYTVSHDLRAPLRTISGFSIILKEDYASKLDTEAQEYLYRIQRGCLRMEQLIEAILRLSRLSRVELNYESVNLSEIACEILNQLRNENPNRLVETIITPGMTVWGDAVLLRAVLENLLGNAWKFTSHTDLARIEFGVQVDQGKPAFFIRDNGAGFDMSHAEKIFSPFQRLHREDEFPGIGVGLATVQRIINRHGGSIRAQSEVGKGATFFFRI
jgi:PAS domain S-box-containing protein